MAVTVGVRIPYDVFEQDARALRAAVARAEAVGLDHLCMGDHASFHGGQGFDGLLQAAALASLTSTLTIETAVYLLALRHPVPVARQVATIAHLAPGRFVFGVGLGGEDRHELEICGVDPTTRGRRLDECLTVVRALLAGETVDFSGGIFEVEQATILPTPPVPVPIVIGGRSDAAFRRAARFGDGWLGLFVSADRYRASVLEVERLAATEGRTDVGWYHGMHFWCGVGSADRLAATMEGLYRGTRISCDCKTRTIRAVRTFGQRARDRRLRAAVHRRRCASREPRTGRRDRRGSHRRSRRDRPTPPRVMTAMTFSFSITAPPLRRPIDAWASDLRRLEDLGFDEVVIADHFTDGYDTEPMVGLTAVQPSAGSACIAIDALATASQPPYVLASGLVASDASFALGTLSGSSD